MFGFSKKKFQVNLASRKKTSVITAPPRTTSLPMRGLGLLVLVCVFAFLAYMVTFGPLAWHSPSATPQTSTSDFPLLSATNTLDAVVKEVGKLYAVPTDEKPTMALITSLDELKDQKFFVKAEIGDIVLMYLKAEKAILWRPTTKQIIEIGPISISEPPPDAVSSTTASPFQAENP